jgi:transcription-repair coupling factor (superfamily II helicase)
MEIYRRIASGDEAQEELEIELEDRFGPLPEPVRELIGMAGLRHRAEELRVQSVTGRARQLKVRFRHDTVVEAGTLIRFVGEVPAASFSPSGVLTVEGIDTENWVQSARNLLETLST